MDTYYREFGALVRDARGSMSQTRLAEVAGLTRAAIANIETGRYRVTIDVLDRIARAVGVPPASLLPPSAPSTDLRPAPLLRAEQQAVERLLARAGIAGTLDDDATA